MIETNQIFILTLAITAFGYLLKHFDYITEQEGKTLSKILMHTTFPALMIISTAKVQLTTSLLLIPLVCCLLFGTSILIGLFVFAKRSNHSRGILTMACGGANVGLFGFPLIEGLFGKESLVYAIMFDIGNTIMIFGIIYPLGVYFSGDKTEKLDAKKILKRVIGLPPLMGMLIGLGINLFQIQLPTIAVDFLETLAKANKPLVLLLMGIYLSFKLSKEVQKDMARVLTIRYGVAFVFLLLLYYFFPNHDSLQKNVLMVCILLPLGMTILPFSDELNYDSRIAGTTLNMSLIISFVLIWGLVGLIM